MPIYYDSERHVIFTKCIDCGKIVEMPCSEEQWVRFELGGLIQNVFPDATPGQREAFVSGICDDCFENMFKAKKSRKSVKKTVNRKEDVHCQNCGSSNVELRQIAEFRSGSVPGSPLRSEHFRIICNDCGATTYDDVQYQASAKKSADMKKWKQDWVDDEFYSCNYKYFNDMYNWYNKEETIGWIQQQKDYILNEYKGGEEAVDRCIERMGGLDVIRGVKPENVYAIIDARMKGESLDSYDVRRSRGEIKGVKKAFEPKLKSFNTVVTEIRKKNNTKKV